MAFFGVLNSSYAMLNCQVCPFGYLYSSGPIGPSKATHLLKYAMVNALKADDLTRPGMFRFGLGSNTLHRDLNSYSHKQLWGSLWGIQNMCLRFFHKMTLQIYCRKFRQLFLDSTLLKIIIIIRIFKIIYVNRSSGLYALQMLLRLFFNFNTW